MNTTPLFLVPLRIEAFAVRLGSAEAEVELIGMGPAKATAARARIGVSHSRTRPLILIGCGGALSRQAMIGDLVVASSILSVEGEVTAVLDEAPKIHEVLLSAGLQSHLGPVISSPSIIWNARDRRKLSSSGALAVDMESQWCAPLSTQHPFAVVRAISDMPGQRFGSLRTPYFALKALASLRHAARVLVHQGPYAHTSGSVMEVRDR